MATTKATTAGPKEACCIAKIRKELMALDPLITAVQFELSNIRTMVGVPRPKKTGQAIKVYYKDRKNKRGELRPVKSFISHQYCPFCGKKYE